MLMTVEIIVMKTIASQVYETNNVASSVFELCNSLL